MLEPEIAALDDGAVDHLGVFVEPSLVLLRTSRTRPIRTSLQFRYRPTKDVRGSGRARVGLYV
jgi:hypothetical protein